MKAKELGLRKNLSEAELLVIDAHLKQRGKGPTQARFGGRALPMSTLKRRIRNARKASVRQRGGR
jgi:hypothetical protein